MTTYTIADWFTGCAEAYYWYLLFEAFLKRREDVSKWIYYGAIAVAAVLINLSNMIFSIGMLNLVLITFIGIAVSYIYEGKIGVRTLSAILGLTIASVTEMITLCLLSVIFKKSFSLIIEAGSLRIIGIVISKLLGLACTKYIVYRVKKELSCIDSGYWILFFVMFAFTTVLMCTFGIITDNMMNKILAIMIYICIFGSALTTVIILYIYERTLKQREIIMLQALLQRQLKDQTKHYNNLIMSQEQVQKTKHDLKNHLIGIRQILNEGSCTEAVEYIDSLIDPIEKTNAFCDTGNTVLDAIINTKRTEAEHKGIVFELDIKIPEDLPIEAADVCVIFGNALDNAIEACEKVEDHPFIKVKLSYFDETLACEISNPYSEETDPTKATTKADVHNHGIGKMSMATALEKYNAILDVSAKNNIYTFTFIILIPYEKITAKNPTGVA